MQICGRRGCLRSVAPPGASATSWGVSIKEFSAGVEAGNPEYAALWDDMPRTPAIGVNNVRMALDCDVVLGGFMTQFMEPYLPLLREYVAACNP